MSLSAAVFSSIGSFELLLAVSQFFAVVITILLIVSLFVLRRREPDLPRPFRAWGYPVAPLIMLVCAVLLFFGYTYSNPYPSLLRTGGSGGKLSGVSADQKARRRGLEISAAISSLPWLFDN